MITASHRIYFACQTFDFRMGIDGFAAVCRRYFNQEPFAGHCFIFRNRRKTAVKILLYDSGGFWLLHKRLSKGQFTEWPKTPDSKVSAHELNRLLKQST